jgi:hypothetical protein
MRITFGHTRIIAVMNIVRSDTFDIQSAVDKTDLKTAHRFSYGCLAFGAVDWASDMTIDPYGRQRNRTTVEQPSAALNHLFWHRLMCPPMLEWQSRIQVYL